MNKVTLFLADDHTIVREGLRLLFNNSKYEVIGEAGDGLSAVEQIVKLKPHISLVDISMPRIDGIEVAKIVKEKHKELKIILLTINSEERFFIEALKVGVDGYILKTINKSDLFNGMEKVLSGEKFTDNHLMHKALFTFLHEEKKEQEFLLLTQRERDILNLLAKGKTNKEISTELYLGTDTVKEYVGNLMKKLDCKNRTQTVAKAIRERMIQ